MKPSQAMIVVIALGFIFWYFSGMFFDWFLGIEFPLIGPIGVEPFSWLRKYGVFIGVVFAAPVMYLLVKKRRGGESG